MSQITNTLLLIKPLKRVTKNNTNNVVSLLGVNENELFQKVINEINELALQLEKLGIQVLLGESSKESETLSAVFSSHWLSFHQQGVAVAFPLSSEKRRKERNENVLNLVEKAGFEIENVIDYSEAEVEGCFLEGMASVVLDRIQNTAYASLSENTQEDVFIEFCEDLEYTPIVFSAVNQQKEEITHTSTVLFIGEKFAIVASGLIADKKERKLVSTYLKNSGKEIIYITEAQAVQKATAIVQVKNNKNELFLLMTEKTHHAFTKEQVEQLEKQGKIVIMEIPTIENIEEGNLSVVLTPVFLPRVK